MINQDFAEFPEHRVGFFKLLRAINFNCFPGLSPPSSVFPSVNVFPALLVLPPNQFKLFMDSIIWAIKHTMRDIAETGLNCVPFPLSILHLMFMCPVCLEVINNFVNADQAVAAAFFQQYFLSILQDIFYVLTDADHKSGFKLQSIVLARLFQLIETNQVQAPLFDSSQTNTTNAVFLKEYCANLLKTAFPHMHK